MFLSKKPPRFGNNSGTNEMTVQVARNIDISFPFSIVTTITTFIFIIAKTRALFITGIRRRSPPSYVVFRRHCVVHSGT